ncbi:MAG TPA: class I adenylate-forming enzyme family protein [Ramlibacter sp.]|nr:class I adenylate-forming enzyme family protein [Ramlibacter sp.]
MARLQPDAPLLTSPRHTWCWKDFAHQMEVAAAALRTTGIEGGERLVVVSENSPTTLVLLLAAQMLRVWPAVINARLPAGEVRSLIQCAQPRLVLFSTEDSDSSRHHAQEMQAAPYDIPNLGPIRLVRQQPSIGPQPLAPDPADEIGTLIFTSGTTGKPKAVMISQRGLLNQGTVVGGGRGTRAQDTIEIVAPLSHVMGTSSVLCALLYGACMRIQPRMAAADLVSAIARGNVTQVSMVPVAWAKLLDQIETERIDVSGNRLRTLVAGGAPLDPELKSRIEHTFGKAVQNAYGMTEVAPLARTPSGRPSLPWSVGRPDANVQVRIVDEHGAQVMPGEVGEIQASGPSVMKGYFANPEATAEVMRDQGWFATGDLGRWLDDGDLAVVGRRKEMIIRSGFNVYPAEVEAALATHPAVLHAAVVGEPAALGDETVVAYLQLRDPQAAGEALRGNIAAHARMHLAPYKIPSVMAFVESMPLGSTGKILKRELKRVR